MCWRQKQLLKIATVYLAVISLTACGGNDSGNTKPQVIFEFNLSEGSHGWIPGFADYPVGEEAFYELSSEWRALPEPLGSFNGIYISGNNHSDDLFMFIKRQVSGLKPFTRYALTFEVQIASNVPQGCAGVGGAPGEGVFVKAGATVPEPVAEIQTNTGFAFYRMNIDHGNQEAGGTNAIVIGNVANSRTNCESGPYELKALNSQFVPFVETTGEEGMLWILFATDSGFEGTTSIYYSHVKITAEEI